jgi:hypothetical protein
MHQVGFEPITSSPIPLIWGKQMLFESELTGITKNYIHHSFHCVPTIMALSRDFKQILYLVIII